jgi:hypothetical protein
VVRARDPGTERRGEFVGLRLIDDEGRLLETEEEANARRADAETRAREEAEARIRELEEQLRRAKGGGSSDGS